MKDTKNNSTNSKFKQNALKTVDVTLKLASITYLVIATTYLAKQIAK